MFLVSISFDSEHYLCTGFLEKEIREDDIVILDTGDNPEAPAPREMTDLEVHFVKIY